jgi:hypothetical protein
MTSSFEPAPTYNVELLCQSLPLIDKARLLAELRLHCPGIEPLDGQESDGLLAFVHTVHLVSYRDRAAPAQAFIAVSDKVPDLTQLASAIPQSWRLKDAAELVASCRHSVVVTDLMASGLAYQTRFDLFQGVLRSLLAIVPCTAIHWLHAEQIVARDDYLASQTGRLADLLGGGPINVRFFKIENSDGDMLMDTRGLSAFGLPDLQCHFRTLDPKEVATLLYNTAFYLYEKGDVIEDGNTVAGVEPSSKWKCQHEDSLAAPERVVLDLNPGRPYAAGNRTD